MRAWMMRLLPVAMLALVTTACKTTGFAGTDLSCQAYEPVRWSLKDTPETVAQIKEHNAAWQALCGKKAVAPAPCKSGRYVVIGSMQFCDLRGAAK